MESCKLPPEADCISRPRIAIRLFPKAALSLNTGATLRVVFPSSRFPLPVAGHHRRLSRETYQRGYVPITSNRCTARPGSAGPRCQKQPRYTSTSGASSISRESTSPYGTSVVPQSWNAASSSRFFSFSLMRIVVPRAIIESVPATPRTANGRLALTTMKGKGFIYRGGQG